MISLISRILSISGAYKSKIMAAFIFSFFKSMLTKAPIGFAFLVLSAFYERKMSAEVSLRVGIWLVICVLFQALFQYIADRMQSDCGYRFFADMRMKFGAHLRKLPMGYFTEGNIGKISSVLSTDMVFIEENCMTVLANIMTHIFSQFILIIIISYLNIWLGLAAVFVTAVMMVIGKGMKDEILKHSDIRQEQSENLTEAVLDFTEGIGIIKTYNLLGEKSAELTNNFRESCKRNLDFEMAHAPWQKAVNIVFGAGCAGILGLSLYLNYTGLISVPYVIGVMLFVFDLLGPVKALYSEVSRLTVMNSCLDRIEEVFNERELADTGKQKIPNHSQSTEIAFRDVSFSYGEKEVLHHIDLEVGKQKMLALVGASGSGKSTIANLITRFWEVTSGEVQIRGIDVRKVSLADLMDHISMVFQRVYLFQDTIYNNIAMGRPEAAENEVIEAAKKARCYEFIMALPEGFQTVIGEGGATLSGGEKQRISIARCILKDAPIVILDEATASVDVDNESYIQEAISQLCAGKTLIVIAHRLNTIQNADQILVLGDGSIVQSGTHEELIRQNGIYQNFVRTRETASGWCA